MLRMSLACWAAIFGSLELTLCGTSCVGDTAFPFGTGAADRDGAAGATPFAAVRYVSFTCQKLWYSGFAEFESGATKHRVCESGWEVKGLAEMQTVQKLDHLQTQYDEIPSICCCELFVGLGR